MDVVDISSLGKSVLWATFAITFALGMVMQKTGFCSMGAITDVFIIASWKRLRQWFLAIGVALFLVFGHIAMISGMLDPSLN